MLTMDKNTREHKSAADPNEIILAVSPYLFESLTYIVNSSFFFFKMIFHIVVCAIPQSRHNMKCSQNHQYSLWNILIHREGTLTADDKKNCPKLKQMLCPIQC